MASSRHSTTSEDVYLDAARECILAVGVKRTTVTDVARKAGVSRMTLYRRWPDMQTLLADLMTREWTRTATEMVAREATSAPTAQQVAATVVTIVTTLRENPLFRKIVGVEPELLLPYLLDRRGRSQDAFLDLVIGMLEAGQRSGSVRDTDAALLARGVLLTAQGFVLSAATMSDVVPVERLDAELRLLLERYLGS